jgi:hypothetical protein
LRKGVVERRMEEFFLFLLKQRRKYGEFEGARLVMGAGRWQVAVEKWL